MLRRVRHNKGQAILPEYVVTFFIVIAVVVGMTSYIQRSFQARLWDARNYMVNVANAACDNNCHIAAGLGTNETPRRE